MLQVTYSSDTCLYLLSLQVASLGHSSNLWGKYLRTLPRPTRCLDLSGLVLQTPGNSPFFSCSGSAHQPLPCTFLIPTLVGITLQQFQHQASGIGVTHSTPLWLSGEYPPDASMHHGKTSSSTGYQLHLQPCSLLVSWHRHPDSASL